MVGRDLFTDELRETLAQFEQAKNFGSLIVPKLGDPAEVARVVRLKDFGSDLLLREVQQRVLAVLDIAEALTPKYHVVVINPPYMGGKGMNGRLARLGQNRISSSLFRLDDLLYGSGSKAVLKAVYGRMINLPSWIFLSSFEDTRNYC